jgi:hypothetical protein
LLLCLAPKKALTRFPTLAGNLFRLPVFVGGMYLTIDKIVQLYDEKIALYERMLREKNELIEKMLTKKK